MEVTRLHEVTDRDYEAMIRLLEQLHGTLRHRPTKDSMIKCLRDHQVFVVRTRLGDILGMGTLVLSARFDGLRAHCEEFVVERSSRRRGIGRAIFLRMVEVAKQNRAHQMELFTNAKNNAGACVFYESLGMKIRPDNVRYVMTGLSK